MESIKNDVAFISEIEKLKTITRFNRTLDQRFENSAEHSWQVALSAIILEKYFPQNLQIDKVIMMLLIHDLGEIYAGDTWLFDNKEKKQSFKKELSSINESLKLLSKEESQKLMELWIEFEKGTSNEARYARIIDAIIPLINHLEVSDKNYNPDNITKEMVIEKKKFIKDESDELWNVVLDLLQKSVDKGLYIE